MELKDITQTYERKKIRMSIRITESNSKFLKDKKISPQLLFDVALKEFQDKNLKK